MQVYVGHEADIGRIRQGMKATFTVDTYPREVFIGR
jgi:multidrug resistance efflux pump